MTGSVSAEGEAATAIIGPSIASSGAPSWSALRQDPPWHRLAKRMR